MSQKVLFLEKPKGAFVVANAPILKPGPGQISIKVISAALNPADWKIQAFDVLIQKYPTILGTDIAGDVEEIGEGVENFAKGDKVYVCGFFLAGSRADTHLASARVISLAKWLAFSSTL